MRTNFKDIDFSHPRMKTHAEKLHGYVTTGMFVSAVALKEIFDNKLYRVLGCKTQNEYVEKYLPFDRTQAYRYIKVADVFEHCLDISHPGEVALDGFLTTGKVENVVPVQHFENKLRQDVWALGLKKLYLIASKMPVEKVKELVDTGAVCFGVGDALVTVEELRHMTYEKIADMINLSNNGNLIISSPEGKAETKQEIDLEKESKAILTQARFVRVKMSQLSQYANPSIASNMGLTIPPEFTAKASQLVDLTNRLLRIEEQLETLLGVE